MQPTNPNDLKAWARANRLDKELEQILRRFSLETLSLFRTEEHIKAFAKKQGFKNTVKISFVQIVMKLNGIQHDASTALKSLDKMAVSEDKAPWIDQGVDAWWDDLHNRFNKPAYELEVARMVLHVFNNVLKNLPETANMTQRQEKIYDGKKPSYRMKPLWLLAGYRENFSKKNTFNNDLIFDDDDDDSMVLLHATDKRLKALMADKILDWWWTGIKGNDTRNVESKADIIEMAFKVYENVKKHLPENANMTQRQKQLYSKNKAGCLKVTKKWKNDLIFDYDNDETVALLQSAHKRLRRQKESAAIGKQNEKFSVWNCPLCTFLNDADTVSCANCGASGGPSMNEDLIKLGMDNNMNDLFATEHVIANEQLSLHRVKCILSIYSLWIASPHRSDINIFDLIDVGLSPFYSFKRLLADYKYLMKNEHDIFGYDGDNDTFVCPLEAKGGCFVFNRYSRDRSTGNDHALFIGKNDQDYRQIFAQQSLDTIHAFVHHSVRINAKEMNVEEIRKRYRQRDSHKKVENENEIKSKFVTSNMHKFDNDHEMVIKIEESIDCFMDKVFDDLKLHKLRSITLHKLEMKTMNNLRHAIEYDEFETDSLRMDMSDNMNSNIVLWIRSIFPLQKQKELVVKRIEASILFLDNLQSQYSAGYRYFYW